MIVVEEEAGVQSWERLAQPRGWRLARLKKVSNGTQEAEAAEVVVTVAPAKDLGEEVQKTGVEAEVLRERQRRMAVEVVEVAPGRRAQELMERRTWTMASGMLVKVAASYQWAGAVPWIPSGSSFLDLLLLQGVASEVVHPGLWAPPQAEVWVQKRPEASALNLWAPPDLTDTLNLCLRRYQCLLSSSV